MKHSLRYTLVVLFCFGMLYLVACALATSFSESL